jgi:hypothetical protein
MYLNSITGEKPNAAGIYPHYIDLVHFTPQVGTALAQVVSVGADPDDLTNDPRADDHIERLRNDVERWRSEKR